MSTRSPLAIDQFRRFIELSRTLIATVHVDSPVSSFQQFLQESTPLLIDPIRTSLEKLGGRLALMQRWLVAHDLLRIAGFTYAEDPYTELIAWAIHPNTHPDSAMQRQRAWLRSFPFDACLDFIRAAIPETQLFTNDGIPDLILKYESFVVVVEAKTGSAEHTAPSGALQTVAYPDAVRHRLSLDESIPIYIVFLTPDRRAAANPKAVNTTFAEFSLSLAAELETVSLPEDLRWAYRMLLTHFFTCAVPRGVDVLSLLRKANEWIEHRDDRALLASKLNEILDAISLLIQEEVNE